MVHLIFRVFILVLILQNSAFAQTDGDDGTEGSTVSESKIEVKTSAVLFPDEVFITGVNSKGQAENTGCYYSIVFTGGSASVCSTDKYSCQSGYRVLVDAKRDHKNVKIRYSEEALSAGPFSFNSTCSISATSETHR